MHMQNTLAMGTTHRYPVQQVLSTPLTVPADFLGMHFSRWPSSRDGAATITNPPQFKYGRVRPHDYGPLFNGGIKWSALHLSDQPTIQGIYDSSPAAWTELDKMVAAHTANGATFYWNIFGCPTWLAGAQYQAAGLYGLAGEAAAATDLTKLRLFIRALLTRVNSGGVRRITTVEGWNEPDFSTTRRTVSFNAGTDQATYSGASIGTSDPVFFVNTGGALPGGVVANQVYYMKTGTSPAQFSTGIGGTAVDVLDAGSGSHVLVRKSSYYWGAVTDCTQFQRAVYQEVKAFDSGILVASPGFTSVQAITDFLPATDGNGGFGKDWFDMVAYHPYDTGLGATYVTSGLDLTTKHAQVRAAMTAGGLSANFPIVFGEQGWQSTSNTANAYFLNNQDLSQAIKIWRHCAVSACLGVTGHFFYTHDTAFMGNPTPANSLNKQSLLNAVSSEICGRTISTCWVNNDGSVTITYPSGLSVTR